MDEPNASAESTAQSRSRLRWLAVGAVAVLIGMSLFARPTSVLDPVTALGVVAVLSVLGIGVLWRRGGTAEGGSADGDKNGEDGDDGDVWNAIPSWQYEGRHVESGGLTRSEQEEAPQEIQQQADELAEDLSRK